MIQRIGVDDQPRKELGQSAQRGIIGDIGGSEEQRRFFAVQIRQFRLQPLVIDRGPGNVAGAP